MTVGELIQLLSDYDEDATVLLCTQPRQPFEYSIDGVIDREEVRYMDDSELPEGAKDNDVLITERSQLRYGRRAAWGC